jgi:hypothetical protein
MSNCGKLEKCPFFHEKLPSMPSMAETLKRKYCLGTFAECARFKVSNAGKTVPADLFPNHAHRVNLLTKS